MHMICLQARGSQTMICLQADQQGSQGLQTYDCPKPFTGIEEHCLGEVYEGRSRLSKCDSKLIMDLIWFKGKNQLKRERVCIV
jgi:hypothetical protein